MFAPIVHFPAEAIPEIWEALVRCNQRWVQSVGVDEAVRLLRTVKWREEQQDEYFLLPEMVARGYDDCEGFAMAWTAILRECGYQCHAHYLQQAPPAEDGAIVWIDRMPDGSVPSPDHAQLDVSALYHGMPGGHQLSRT